MIAEQRPVSDRFPEVSDRALELFALGELRPDEAAEFEQRLSRDPVLAERLRSLRASNREILSQHPPAVVAAEVRRRAETRLPARRWRPLLLTAPALAAAAVFLLLRPVSEGEGERVKGKGPHLVALLVRGGQAEPLADGARVVPGDVVQLAYVAAGLSHGVILSIDSRGGVTLHWPEDPTQPARLEPREQIGLPHAFKLDDAPGVERFFLIAAREPISVARVLDAARAAGREAAAGRRNLNLPSSWIQDSLQLRKETP